MNRCLKKSVRCQSVDPTADLRLQSAVHTRHSQPAVTVQCCVSSLTNEACRFDDHAHVLPESIVYTYGVSHFIVVHFVAKRYILEQKCQKGRIGTWMLGSR